MAYVMEKETTEVTLTSGCCIRYMVPVYVTSDVINVAAWLRYQTRLSTVTSYYSLCNYKLP